MISKYNKTDAKMVNRWANKLKDKAFNYRIKIDMESAYDKYCYDHTISNSSWDYKPRIPLSETETICPVCGGLGFVMASNYNVSAGGIDECGNCKGRGKLDWCSRLVVGVKR